MNAEKTGAFICKLRTERNITQQQLAALLNVSDKAVSRWETGRGFPDIGNLEALSEKLGVSVGELLKGERLSAQITEKDIAEVSSASFSAARYFVEKKKWMNMAIGFLIGVIIILLVVIHITSPIPIKNAENALTVEILADQDVVAVLDDTVAGYEISNYIDPDTSNNCVFVSSYDTIWNHWFGNENKLLVSLGDKDSVDYVYYYPADEADQLVWKNAARNEPDGGVITLPRLVYNYWIMIGTALSLFGIAVCALSRKKYYWETAVKATLIPVALTLSMAAILTGRYGTIYNASYYFSGILLLAILFYVLFMLLFVSYKQRKRNASE